VDVLYPFTLVFRVAHLWSDLLNHTSCKQGLRRRAVRDPRANRQHSSRSSRCLLSVTASLDTPRRNCELFHYQAHSGLSYQWCDREAQLDGHHISPPRRRWNRTCFMTTLTKPGCGVQRPAKATVEQTIYICPRSYPLTHTAHMPTTFSPAIFFIFVNF